jgi:hypothetical protein
MNPPAAKTLASEGVQERLYRDDVGAALERVRRLEQENQGLRAEIDRIKSGQPAILPSPYRIGTIALCIATIAVGTSLAFSSATQPAVFMFEPSPPPPPTAILIEPVPQPIRPAPTLQPAPVVQATPDCNPPYAYDGHGRKTFKKECL